MGRLYPFFQLSILFNAVVPYVPFVEGKIDLFFSMLLYFYSISDGNHS